MGHSERSDGLSNEEHLLQACRRGDRQALDQLFRLQSPAVHRLLLRIVGPRPEVEDLLEATFSAAIDAFPRFRGEASVERWLAGIATRVAFCHYRYAKFRTHASLELLCGPDEPRDSRPPPDRAAETRRCIERLYHHLEKLGSKKRITFALYFLDGRPIAEVAAIIGESPTLTKGRIFLARRSLLVRAQKDPVLRELLRDRSAKPGCAGLGIVMRSIRGIS